ncbi:hypothetical protein F4819DRAFT_316922 [Hypoxylon fuscum]|nr:hypothetical protein F4819DRAFT_316922 [Hypoxylon fuscum]
MFPTDFRSKRFCLQVLIWSRLFFTSRCDGNLMGGHTSELGVLGSPVVHLSTITITTTIAYNPTLAPGDSTYLLLGCYSQPDDNSRGGHPFGQGEDYTAPAVSPDELTIDACLDGCASLRLRNDASNDYIYAGLKNGRECFCGSRLVPGAHEISADECKTPCTGDTTLSCGGANAIAIYDLAAATEPNSSPDGSAGQGSNDENIGNDGNNNGDSDEASEDNSNPATGTLLSSSGTAVSAVLKATGVSQPTEVESKSPETSEGAFFKTTGLAGTTSWPSSHTASSSAISSSPEPGSPGTPATSSTIAAVTGTISGAIILAALIFLCTRAYKRKKQKQDALTRGVSTKSDKSQGKRSSRRPIPSAIDTKKGHRKSGRGQRDDDARHISVATNNKDLMPTTPALESGGRHTSGLHSRLKSPSSTSDRDALYDVLMGEVRAAPAIPKPPLPPVPRTPPSATSSAVQWRGGLPPQTPTTVSAALFDFGFHNDSSNNHNARASPTTPAAAALPEAALGARAWHRRKLSTPFQPPPSGPPSIPLPPTPPMRARQLSHTGIASSGAASTEHLLAPPGTLYALAAANASARSLGSVPPTPPLKDSPTLPRTTHPGDRGRDGKLGEAGAARGGGGEWSGGDMAPPSLAPTTGEQSDSPRWRGAVHADTGDRDRDKSRDGVEDENRRSRMEEGRVHEELGSPSSASTVSTSILFPLNDEDRTWSGA